MFARLSGRTSGRITLGFLQVAPGADVAKVQAELKEVLPHDVQVLTHDELVAQEQAYFVETKPIGIMMDVGMLIACLVAVTIMIQVLATDIGNRMNEYAVLKAMGFGPFFVYGIGVMQSAILGVVGLLPAVAVSAVVLGIIQERTHLQSGLDLRLSGMALGITLGTAVLASAVVLWRLQRADPAALY
jgi:putative ABC transport system permease protein